MMVTVSYRSYNQLMRMESYNQRDPSTTVVLFLD